MDDHNKELIIQLTDKLYRTTHKFIIDIIFKEKEPTTSDLINLLLSSYLSSLFTMMSQLSSEHLPMKEKVGMFIKDMQEFIALHKSITAMEVVKEKTYEEYCELFKIN